MRPHSHSSNWIYTFLLHDLWHLNDFSKYYALIKNTSVCLIHAIESDTPLNVVSLVAPPLTLSLFFFLNSLRNAFFYSLLQLACFVLIQLITYWPLTTFVLFSIKDWRISWTITDKIILAIWCFGDEAQHRLKSIDLSSWRDEWQFENF